MKTLQTLLVVLFITIAGNSFAQAKITKDTIKVWGNCGMCKTTIEKAAKKAGASFANWDSETKVLVVRYASSTTANNKIQKEISAVGYDTELFTAPTSVYDKLHGCCKYERKENQDSNTKKQ